MGRGSASRVLKRLVCLVQDAAGKEGVKAYNDKPFASSAAAVARGYAQATVATPTSTQAPTHLYRDVVGAVSVVSQTAENLQPDVYYNIDGHRVDDGRFTAFAKDVQQLIPAARVFTDPVRTFAYGTDASFYRLNPKMVIKVHNEEEMTRLLPIARKHNVPVTFRAAGTSLSGQALTDSVLLKISHTGKNFRNFSVHVRLVCTCYLLCGVQTKASNRVAAHAVWTSNRWLPCTYPLVHTCCLEHFVSETRGPPLARCTPHHTTPYHTVSASVTGPRVATCGCGHVKLGPFIAIRL
jgi:hypothetical protein